MHRFEIYKNREGKFVIRFKWNAEVIFSSTPFASKRSAMIAIRNIKKRSPEAGVEDNS